MCMICVVQVLNVVIICCVSFFMYTTITSDGYTGGMLQCIIILSRVNNGRESIQLPYTASKMSKSSREAIL